MSEREFNRKVAAIQNVVIPEAERVAGHALLPTDRRTITTLIRESLADPDPRKVAALKAWLTPKAPPVRPAFTETAKVTSALLEQTPPAAPPAPKNALLEERVRAELKARVLAWQQLGHRRLTLEEQNDLEATIRERFGESFAGTTVTEASGHHAFGEAVMAGRLGPAKSPGLARPEVRTASQVSEGAALVPGHSPRELKDHFDELARGPLIEGAEGFHAAMAAWARTIPFGAQRLDGR